MKTSKRTIGLLILSFALSIGVMAQTPTIVPGMAASDDMAQIVNQGVTKDGELGAEMKVKKLPGDVANNKSFYTHLYQYEALPSKATRKAIANANKKVVFDYNSSVLNPRAKAALDKVANAMNKSDSFSLVVDGQPDITGNSSLNKKVAAERSYAIYSYLQKLGVEPDRMIFKDDNMEEAVNPEYGQGVTFLVAIKD